MTTVYGTGYLVIGIAGLRGTCIMYVYARYVVPTGTEMDSNGGSN